MYLESQLSPYTYMCIIQSTTTTTTTTTTTINQTFYLDTQISICVCSGKCWETIKWEGNE